MWWWAGMTVAAAAPTLVVELGSVAVDDAPVADPEPLLAPHLGDVVRCLRPAIDEDRYTLGEKAMLSLVLADGRGTRPRAFGLPDDAKACLESAMRRWKFRSTPRGELTAWFAMGVRREGDGYVRAPQTSEGPDELFEDADLYFPELDRALRSVGGIGPASTLPGETDLPASMDCRPPRHCAHPFGERAAPRPPTERVEPDFGLELRIAGDTRWRGGVARKRGRFLACVERAAVTGPPLETVAFSLDLTVDQGWVFEADIGGDGLPGGLVACLGRVARTLRLDPSLTGSFHYDLDVEPRP